MNTFLPDDYEVPKSDGKFAKIGDGDNKFLMLGSVVMGYKYWNTLRKPVLLKEKPKNVPDDIGVTKDGKQETIKHFWAIPVYHIDSKRFQILEITQVTLMGKLQDLARDKDWGDPVLKYPINIKKSGADLLTKYEVVPIPAHTIENDIKIITQGYEESEIDMSKFFESTQEVDEKAEETVDEIANQIGM